MSQEAGKFHPWLAAGLSCALALLVTGPAWAQSARSPNPADPSVTVPAPRYESAFSDYVRQRDEKIAPWRGVNDEVARAGGHIGILRGAAEPGPKREGN